MTIEPKDGAGNIIKNSNDFSSDYLYLNFYSIRGCSVRVTVQFPKGNNKYFYYFVSDEGELEKGVKKVKMSLGVQIKRT